MISIGSTASRGSVRTVPEVPVFEFDGPAAVEQLRGAPATTAAEAKSEASERIEHVDMHAFALRVVDAPCVQA